MLATIREFSISTNGHSDVKNVTEHVQRIVREVGSLQQIVVIDHDNRPRQRMITVQILEIG